jgi:hypothetical protein
MIWTHVGVVLCRSLGALDRVKRESLHAARFIAKTCGIMCDWASALDTTNLARLIKLATHVAKKYAKKTRFAAMALVLALHVIQI